MPPSTDSFYRIQKLPPYVFAVINEMKAKARAAQQDVIDLGMGNPDGATPRAVVNKLIEASRNPRNHRYSVSRGIPHLRVEIARRYQKNYGVAIDPDSEAIVTIGAKDALAHLLFAVIGPGDVVVSPNPAYPIHQYGVIMAEGQACMLPMPDAATFLAGLEDLYRGSSRPKVILISFPHNPTTTCVDLDFFREVVR
ncbi:MAG TPA: aminotransferase class I/II-fold pyridoxal phosphate-dependent enzyme, partial [Bryobacteraceae bacterium]|nr:aminotransferase class I/II-fold pyridoxal phosphate-dependent enzyme [Bryobacteraceae bacterium]